MSVSYLSHVLRDLEDKTPLLQEVFDKKYSTNLNECGVGVYACGEA